MARKGPKTLEELAVENGLVTELQIKECAAALEQAPKDSQDETSLEDILLAKGFITREELRALKTALDRISRDEEKGEPLRIGNYEIAGKIGDGGLGTVYKARQMTMGRDVALKVLHKKWLADEEFKKRFLLEARLAGRLSHQNLIQVYDVGRERGVYYFSMEFVDGETVEDILERDGPLDIDKALDFTTQIFRAITYIRRFEIVHRDIKPGNIMVTRAGVAKLGDFGFVKSQLDPVIATEGEVLGTPDYISPEQAMGAETIDWRSDQYSLGCSLYHMLTGKPPYEGTGSSVMRQHIKSEVRDPRTLNPKIPDSVIHLLERMMAKDPADRYQDPNQFFDDIGLVKVGQDPASARLSEGKSSFIRAYRIEQARAQRAKSEIEILRDEVRRMRRIMYAALIAAGLMVLVTILVLVLKITAAN